MRPWILTVLGLLALLLGARNDDSAPDTTGTTPVPPTNTASPVAAQLLQDYESLTASQQAILAVWEGLAANEQVQCGDYPDVITPESISAEGDTAQEPLAERLRSAAIDIDYAVKLWRAECANPRQNPAPDVVNEGRLAARAAGDTLQEVQALLNSPQ